MNSSRRELEQSVREAYVERYGSPPHCLVSAPGRVNLIGEHTDYNDGFVFPAAIDRATAIGASARPDHSLLLHAENLGATMLLDLKDLHPRRTGSWSNYPAGVAYYLLKEGITLRGTTMIIKGDIPRGAGLSSSAALEVASAYAFLTLNGVTMSPLDVIKLCQKAENEFVGVKCGIMDQFISCLGKKDHALLIDCRSLAYEHVPLPSGVRLIVCDTGVKRALASSEYNRRREECAAGVHALAGRIPGIRMLRDVTPGHLMEFGELLDPVVLKRCRHVVTENDRVTRSVDALRARDLVQFGSLMYASHASLRDNYEVSCPELDAVVEICAGVDGVFGARMTGAGFGGCAICLVREQDTDAVIERLRRDYPGRTGKNPGITVCTFEQGVNVSSV